MPFSNAREQKSRDLTDDDKAIEAKRLHDEIVFHGKKLGEVKQELDHHEKALNKKEDLSGIIQKLNVEIHVLNDSKIKAARELDKANDEVKFAIAKKTAFRQVATKLNEENEQAMKELKANLEKGKEAKQTLSSILKTIESKQHEVKKMQEVIDEHDFIIQDLKATVVEANKKTLEIEDGILQKQRELDGKENKIQALDQDVLSLQARRKVEEDAINKIKSDAIITLAQIDTERAEFAKYKASVEEEFKKREGEISWHKNWISEKRTEFIDVQTALEKQHGKKLNIIKITQ